MKKTSPMLRTGLVALLLSPTSSWFGQFTLSPIDQLGPENPTMANTTKDRATVFDPEVKSFADELINSILFFNPDQDNSFTLRASKTEDHVDGREMEFTSYVWYEGTNGTDYTEITGETGMTLSRSGLTPGYHYYQVRGVINPSGLDETLLCEGPTETFVVFVLPPVTVTTTNTSTTPALQYCENEAAAQENITLSAGVNYASYSGNPQPVTEFGFNYRWYYVKSGDTDDVFSRDPADFATIDPTKANIDGATLITGATSAEYKPAIDVIGTYKFFVEVEYQIKDRNRGLGTDNPEDRNRPYVIYRGWFGGVDQDNASIVTVTPAPGRPHITIEGVND